MTKNLHLPALCFTKKHNETGIIFKDKFSSKNCPEWDNTPLHSLLSIATKRIEKWNDQLSDWEYTITGWEIDNES